MKFNLITEPHTKFLSIFVSEFGRDKFCLLFSVHSLFDSWCMNFGKRYSIKMILWFSFPQKQTVLYRQTGKISTVLSPVDKHNSGWGYVILMFGTVLWYPQQAYNQQGEGQSGHIQLFVVM